MLCLFLPELLHLTSLLGFKLKFFFYKLASRMFNLLMTGLRKVLQLGILMTMSNKEEKAHPTVNGTSLNGK